MKLIDYLRVPYVLEAESTEATPGVWVSRVSYPELPDCVELAATIEDAVDKLERRRIELIAAMLRRGRSWITRGGAGKKNDGQEASRQMIPPGPAKLET